MEKRLLPWKIFLIPLFKKVAEKDGGGRITEEMKAESLQMCINVRLVEPFQVQLHNFIWIEV